MKKEKKSVKSKGKSSGVTTTQKTTQKQETKINIKIGDTKKKNAKRGRAIVRDRVSYVSVPPVVSLQSVPQVSGGGLDAFPKAFAQGLRELLDPKPVKNAADVAQEVKGKELSKVERDAEALREKVRVAAEGRVEKGKSRQEEFKGKVSKGIEQMEREDALKILKPAVTQSYRPFVSSGENVLPSTGSASLMSSLEGAAGAAAAVGEETPAPKKRGRKPKNEGDNKKITYKMLPKTSEVKSGDIRAFFLPGNEDS